METKEKEKEDVAWIPLEEVKEYLLRISQGLEGISKGILDSLEQVDAKIKEQGENNDGN